MHTAWKKLLEAHGAHFDDTRLLHFGDPAAELEATTSGRVLADLSHLGVIAASGQDTPAFLQGQLSNDVRQVSETRSQLSAYCSPKGRVLASFRLFRMGESFYLCLPRASLEPTLRRLRMFVLRAHVTLEDVSDRLARLGYAGPGADAALQQQLGAVPNGVDEVVQQDGLAVIRLPGTAPRFEVHGEVDAVARLWGRLAADARPVAAAPWGRLDVLAGLPTVYPETADAFVPQMLNLQAVGGISFRKGCYPGQEVVARTQYLGKLKRRMYLAHADTDEVPAPGTEIVPAAVAEEGQSAGKVVEAYAAPQGGCDLLAVLQTASIETGELRLQRPDGPRLQVQELPYPLEP